MASPSLQERLSNALPKDARLTIHHCAALPTSTEPLFVAAPNAKQEATELESHFFSASIQSPDGLVQAFAIEVLAYTTTTLTTLFVSKADSTGYLHLLGLPAGAGSLIRVVLVQFLIHLIEAKKQANSRLVLSLFARAQDQYLFPGSIENSRKHVLDDRGLIKWWARILDDVFAFYKSKSPSNGVGGVSDSNANETANAAGASDFHVRGHLVVPGIDQHETRSFIPRDADYKTSTFWQVTDPLKSLGMPEGVPERCLIPRFPDDPKARYAVELDDELAPEPPKEGDSSERAKSASDRWRSVRSLETFWEFMSYRQECSAGRLTGFIWGIWEPTALVGKPFQATVDGQDRLAEAEKAGQTQDQRHTLPTPESSQQQPDGHSIPSLPKFSSPSLSLPASSGLATPASTQPAPSTQTPSQTQPSENPDTVPPPIEVVEPRAIPPLVKTARADLTLTADAYARSMELLLTLDYCDLSTAIDSTRKLLSAIGEEGGKSQWGLDVVGQKQVEKVTEKTAAGEVNSLAGLVRKRPKPEATTLSAGLVRKKPKT